MGLDFIEGPFDRVVVVYGFDMFWSSFGIHCYCLNELRIQIMRTTEFDNIEFGASIESATWGGEISDLPIQYDVFR